MHNLRLSEPEKTRLFPGLLSREQAGFLPIDDVDSDWRSAPALTGAALRAFWDRVFDERADLAQTAYKEFLLAAWRLTRQLAIVRGVIQADQPLEAINTQISWTNSEFTTFVNIDNPVLRSLLEGGVALTCPPAPESFMLPGGHLSPDYDPSADAPLMRFVDLVSYFGQVCLRLEASPLTRRGFVWFCSPDYVRAGWPTPTALISLETRIVDECIDLLTDLPQKQARDEIAARWDLGPDEVQQLTMLSRRALSVRVRLDDRDGYKAMIVTKLERCAERATEALDNRGAAQILRDAWRIFDSRGEQDIADEFGDMADIISVSAKTKRKRALPEPSED